MRHGDDADGTPLRVGRQETRRLPRIAAGGDLAETKMRKRGPDLLRRQREGDVRHADVRALGEHGGDVDRAVVVLVLENLHADLEEARRGVDDAALVVFTGGESGGHEERLDGRTGLEDIGGRPVAIGRRLNLLAVVGVVGGLVHHGEHLAAGDVEHDRGAGAGTLVADRRLQLAVREVLDAQVDRQHQIAPRTCRPDALHVLHDASVAVLDDTLRAILAGEPVIERELQALLAGIVDVGEPEQMPAHLARGVIAAVLARGVHARDPECLDLRGFRGLAMAREVQELALEIAGDTAREF